MIESLIKFTNYFSIVSMNRGIDLYEHGAVSNIKKINNSYFFDVKGLTGNYKVSISFDENNEVESCYCSCPHFGSGYLCKHIYACVLELNDILDADEDFSDLDSDEIIAINDKPHQFKNIEETNKDIKEKKTKIEGEDLDLFKYYCNSVEFTSNSMLHFLDRFDLKTQDLIKLFQMIKRSKPMEIFLKYYEKELNEDFFKNINLASFPKITQFNALVRFLFKHSNMIEYLNDNSFNELFTKVRVSQISDRVTLLFLCLNINQTRAIKSFLLEPTNNFTFFQEVAFLNYLKTNMTETEWLSVFETRIKNITLTSMQAGFIYPYLSEETIKRYNSFFANNYNALDDGFSYYSSYEYEGEHPTGQPLNRHFYNLMVKQLALYPTDYDLKFLYFLRELLFTSENQQFFVKRFRTLALSLFRSKVIDSIKLYCCLTIILEYADKISSIKDLELRAFEYVSKICNSPERPRAELYELFYKLALRNRSKEDNIIFTYNQEA